MVGLLYRRDDFPLLVRRNVRGGAQIESALAEFPALASLSAKVVRDWLDEPHAIPVRQLRKLPLLQQAIQSWRAGSLPVHPPLEAQESLVARVTLEIADRDLAALPWEQALLDCFGLGDLPVVRFCPVFPHVEDVALTLPLRFLHVDPQPDLRVTDIVPRVFEGYSAESVMQAVLTAECALDAVHSSRETKLKWPTAEILQFDNLRTLRDPANLLTTASPETPGTLGWLLRLTDTWQTRLVILRTKDAATMAAARQLLDALAARGGPAGLVVGQNAPQILPYFYGHVIHDLPLDLACQTSLGTTLPRTQPSLYIGAWRAESLRVSRIANGLQKFCESFEPKTTGPEMTGDVLELRAEDSQQYLQIEFNMDSWESGKGFELKELNLASNLKFREPKRLYVGNLAHGMTSSELERLFAKYGTVQVAQMIQDRETGRSKGFGFVEMHNDEEAQAAIQGLNDAENQGRPLRVNEVRPREVGSRGLGSKSVITKPEVVAAAERIKKQIINLKNVSHSVSGLEFDRERKGMLPLAQQLHDIRTEFNVLPEATGELTAKETTPAIRHVNSNLWKRRDNTVVRLDPKADPLESRQFYQLGIQIGGEDLLDVAIGRIGLIKEQIKWSEKLNGAWIEIGVTGLDFEVRGEPVQELWLPRDADSARIYFSIRPKAHGVQRLRFCIYNEQNLIQSFRLAAWVESDPNTPPTDTDRRKLLADALGVDLKVVPEETRYASRCEYSLTPDAAGIVGRPPRALSIAANEWNDESVITVKGADKFGVSTLPDLKDYVKRARKSLQNASVKKGRSTKDPDYAFGRGSDWNAATAEMLEEPLQMLAKTGWELYDKIFPEAMRDGLNRALKSPSNNEDPIIAVANILVDKVIPWSLLYDRKFRTGVKSSAGQPVAYGTCLAAVPDQKGNLPFRECKEHASCLLHRDQIEQRKQKGEPQLLEETVVCPLRFWGFRNIIESPSQQTDPGKREGQRQSVEHIFFSGAAKAVAGFNSSLVSHADHLSAMQRLFSHPPVAGLWSSTSDHDQVAQQLQQNDLHVIYLFCHAWESDDTTPPTLEFDAQGFLTASDLDYSPPWSTHPLIFLNGCQTAAFSPEALSPFVVKFVRDRAAAGVVGTEAPVWEWLAAEFAEIFFREFLGGTPAGKSLLLARRVLLAKLNPLGLTYTLFALAELDLKASSAATVAQPVSSTTPAASD